MNELKLPMDVAELLPQKPPMVMVDTVLECTHTMVKTRFFIREDNLFAANGILHEEGLLENIAQTAAAQAAVLGGDGGKTIGVIGAISKVNIRHLPRTGSTIETDLTIMYRIQNVTIIEGRVRQDEQILASCEMKIFAKSGE